MLRDEKWLFSKLDQVWDKYFFDVMQENDVKILWGRRARNRLGSIKQSFSKKEVLSPLKKQASHPITIITINALFKDKKIPEFVVISTIAHELAHYAHGFSSPLEQKYLNPHAGGVIDKEMDKRGLRETRILAKKWLKENWRNYILENFPKKQNKRRSRKIILRWI